MGIVLCPHLDYNSVNLREEPDADQLELFET